MSQSEFGPNIVPERIQPMGKAQADAEVARIVDAHLTPPPALPKFED